MPLLDALLPLWHAHRLGDCSHYYADPWIWEPWHLALGDALRDGLGWSE